jgi:hypothetical protein
MFFREPLPLSNPAFIHDAAAARAASAK